MEQQQQSRLKHRSVMTPLDQMNERAWIQAGKQYC